MEASVRETALDLTDTVETVDDLDLKCNSDVDVGLQKTVESNLPFSHLENIWQVHDRDASGYSPSAPTDFSGFLPGISVDSDLRLIEKYDPDSMVRAAWRSLQPTVPKLPWEGNFWDRFLDPNVSAMDMLESSFKRPLPAPVVSEQFNSHAEEVERRVVHKPFKEVKGFLQHVRDVPERSWKEEREALWETAIRRWVATMDEWQAGDSKLLEATHECKTFTEKAQILVDVFYNKAPQTLTKRVNSLQKLCLALKEEGIRFPCSESQFYSFLKQETCRGAPSSRLKSFFEAVVFTRFVLGIETLQAIVDSRRCVGAAMNKVPGCPRQADPFTVVQLRIFHAVLKDSDEVWNQVMAGMILFCVYARARWSDAQHAEGLETDLDSEGRLRFLEVKTSVHKTARAFHLRHQFLPMAAPTQGVTDDNWGEQWMKARTRLHIDDLTVYPLMPAPDSNLEPTKRPLSTQEAKLWMHELLAGEVKPGSKLTSD